MDIKSGIISFGIGYGTGTLIIDLLGIALVSTKIAALVFLSVAFGTWLFYGDVKP